MQLNIFYLNFNTSNIFTRLRIGAFTLQFFRVHAMHGPFKMWIILSKVLQKILLTAFSGRLVITFDVVINLMSLHAMEYILFEFKKVLYSNYVTYWGFSVQFRNDPAGRGKVFLSESNEITKSDVCIQEIRQRWCYECSLAAGARINKVWERNAVVSISVKETAKTSAMPSPSLSIFSRTRLKNLMYSYSPQKCLMNK